MAAERAEFCSPKRIMPALLAMVLLSAASPLAASRTTKPTAVEQAVKPVESPIRTAGVLFKVTNRRDPFLSPLLLKKEAPSDEELSRGLPPPGIAGTYIAQAVLQGVSMRGNGRIAIIRGADSRAYFLREGDKLFDGFIKHIDIDSITMVRVTKLRSGKTLTREVTKRLRTQ